MKKYLFNEAYNFYPTGIHGLDELYNEKPEIKRLINHLTNSIKGEYDIWKNLIFEFNLKKEFQVIDYTNFLISKPCLHFKILLFKDGNYTEVLDLYSSLIIPFYYFSISKMKDNIILSITKNQVEEIPYEVKKFIEKIKINFFYIFLKIKRKKKFL